MYTIRLDPEPYETEPRWIVWNPNTQRFRTTRKHETASHFFTRTAVDRIAQAFTPPPNHHPQIEHCTCPPAF